MAMKQKTYEGYGILNCMNVCKEHNLTPFNSDLHIDCPKDLNSKWKVTVK